MPPSSTEAADATKASSKSDIRILSTSFRRYAGLIALTCVAAMLASIFEGISIGLLIPFLQTLDNPETAGIGIAWVDTYLLGATDNVVQQLYLICGFILLATLLRSAFGYAAAVLATMSRVRIVEDLRMRIVDQLQSVSLSFFSRHRSGDLLNSLMNEIARSATTLGALFTLINEGTMLLVYLGLMFWISWEMSLIVLIFFSVLSYSLTFLIRRVRRHGEKITDTSATFTGALSEFIQGIRTVVAFNRQQDERDHLERATRNFADAVVTTAMRRALIKPLTQGVVSMGLIALIVVAVQFFVLEGALDLAFLLAFLFALLRMMPTVLNLNGIRGEWAESRAGLANIAQLLRTEDKPYLSDGSRQAPALQEEIRLEHVDFKYHTGPMVLKDISLTIKRGATTAFVGGSGAGKSTLADLIPRFHDPTEGRVLYDGVDLREFSVKSLRDRIAIVSQNTFIFNDSVRANIAYGRPDATMEEIVTAAEQANALPFIEEMAEGFETSLGDQGIRLSGGQRQRLAIARALLKDPEILILDEATSALDSVSEQAVQQSLQRLMKGRTVIAIAHRLSTIEHADWVVVLEEGRIAEQGPYHELIAQEGALWSYHKIQYASAASM
ncbi:MAG: ABC transporter ATP-binding protein [Longimonas sp.]|uniref:heterocyst formation ABC transporter subunit HepA n=1 Tax=Longimonas sp. TaxID=2039626 RepID=UPI003352F3EC